MYDANIHSEMDHSMHCCAAGPLKGTAVVSASSTAGACVAFLVSRYLARPLVESKVSGTLMYVLSRPTVGRLLDCVAAVQ
jgi:hypothetical protein